MNAARQTRALLVLLVVLVAVDAGVQLRGAPDAEAPPAVAAFAEDEPVALTVTWGEERARIERTDEGWRLAGLDVPADAELVEGTLALLGRGVATDARVDDGDHLRYGLDGADPVLVEIDGAAGPLARFYVGHNTGGGATFVRFPDDETVYRARIGGRSRFARPAAAWRDHRIFRFSADEVVAVQVGADRFVRDLGLDPDGQPITGPWRLDGDPGFPVDETLLDALARTLGELRALEILSPTHPAGFPAGALEVQTDDGRLHPLELGRTDLGAFARTEPGAPVHRLPPQLVDLLAAGLEAWQDRTLLDLDLVVAMTLEDDAGLAVAELDRRTNTWALLRPANVDADPRRLAQAATFLSKLRVEDFVTPADPGFPTARLRIADGSGTVHEVELGRLVPGRPEGQEQIYVRLASEPDRIGVISARTWSALRQAWAR